MGKDMYVSGAPPPSQPNDYVDLTGKDRYVTSTFLPGSSTGSLLEDQPVRMSEGYMAVTTEAPEGEAEGQYDNMELNGRMASDKSLKTPAKQVLSASGGGQFNPGSVSSANAYEISVSPVGGAGAAGRVSSPSYDVASSAYMSVIGTVNGSAGGAGMYDRGNNNQDDYDRANNYINPAEYALGNNNGGSSSYESSYINPADYDLGSNQNKYESPSYEQPVGSSPPKKQASERRYETVEELSARTSVGAASKQPAAAGPLKKK
eukprot:m.159743 g.159743  ORF g.159743 m.159743 type:complete len:262 (+) comp17044_c3_seq10:1-786(+)